MAMNLIFFPKQSADFLDVDGYKDIQSNKIV